MIEFVCQCGKSYRVSDHLAGKTGSCKQCGARFRIPGSVTQVEAYPVTEVEPAKPLVKVATQAAPQGMAPQVNVGVAIHNPAERKGASGLGVAAVVLGVLALLACWIPLVNLGAFLAAVLGGVLGLVGLVLALTNKRSGAGWPMAGVVLNGLAVIGVVAVNLMLASAAIETGRAVAKAAEQGRKRAEEDRARADAESKAQLADAQAKIDAAIKSTGPAPSAPGDPKVDQPQGEMVAEIPANAPKPIDPSLAPDPNWEAKPGDLAILYNEDKAGPVIVAKDMFAYDEFIKSVRARDGDGAKTLQENGRIAALTSGTAIRVIEQHRNQFIGGGFEALEVRFMDGPLKGKGAWVPRAYVAMMVPKASLVAPEAESPAPKPAAKPKAEPKPIDPVARAASALNVAELLEKSGKVVLATKSYQKLIRDYPGTPAAEAAQKHLDALSGKPAKP